MHSPTNDVELHEVLGPLNSGENVARVEIGALQVPERFDQLTAPIDAAESVRYFQAALKRGTRAYRTIDNSVSVVTAWRSLSIRVCRIVSRVKDVRGWNIHSVPRQQSGSDTSD